MKKRVVGRKLSRDSSSRKALLRSLARALMSYGKIDTTFAKAKFAQKFVERLLSQAQDKSLSARRRILAELGNDRFTMEAFYKNIVQGQRKSGFTRITRLPARKGDAAEMARLEVLDWKPEEPKEKIEPKGKEEKVKSAPKRAKKQTK